MAQRIVVLDGAWGTMLQRQGLEDADYRGDRFRDHPRDVKGDPDLLNLTRPDVVLDVHRAYLDAGADITTTNTFTATSIGQADYGLEDAVYDMNVAGAQLARQAADELGGRFVAGSVGPLNQALSLSPRVEDPAYRNVTFDEVRDSYAEQIRGLRDGGVDLLLVETVFDTLNAKAAIVAAIDEAPELPLWLSVTIVDLSGRTLSGQTLEAFWLAVEHARPLIVGVNCSLGAREMRPHVEELSRLADTFTSCHPNAGLPNAFGDYDELPPDTLQAPARVCRGRFRERRGRLLRHDPGAHAGDRGLRLGPAAPPRARAQARLALLGPRAVRDLRGVELRDDRRADERHGLHAVPPARRVGRLHWRGGRRARAGARRRQPPGREHGRRPARLRGGDDDVPEHPRHRAGGCAAADRGRQLALVRHPGRPQVRPGQAGRQLDQPEGGGGGLPRQGPRGAALRGGARRHGLRRAGPGRDGRAQGLDLRPRLRPSDPGGRRPARGHHLRPEHPRDRDRDRGARRVRQGVHRGDPADQGALSGRADLGRDLEPLVLVPRQRRRARGDPRGLPLPRHSCRARHGDRERGPARGLRGHPARPPRARRGHHLRPPARRDRAHGGARRGRARRGDEAGARPLVARRAGREAARPRARPRHRRLDRGGHRGGAAGGRAARST